MARGRSAKAHQKVLDAAAELVAELGVNSTSMDAIAGRSGVSKATIYKHWSDKEALLLELMAHIHGLHKRPSFSSGNIREDMVAVLSYNPQEHCQLRERLLPHFVAYSASNQQFGMTWRKMVMEPPLRELKHLIQLGVDQGELAADLNLELALGLLLGPILYWHIFQKKLVDDRRLLAREVVEAFFRAFSRAKRPKRADSKLLK
jgi:AcrR family transcriptional regulator